MKEREREGGMTSRNSNIDWNEKKQLAVAALWKKKQKSPQAEIQDP